MTTVSTWRWSRFGLGIVLALPAIAVAPFAPAAALALATGVLPATVLGSRQTRRGLSMIPLIGCLCAGGLLLGSLLSTAPPVAVAALFASGLLAGVAALRGRIGRVLLVSALPMTGLGLSFPWSTDTVALAGGILIGSVYAWLVAALWAGNDPQQGAADPVPRGRAMVVYGVLLGTAAATAAALGFLIDPEHAGWAAGAVLLVMRPVRGQLVVSGLWRAGAVLTGALVATGLAAAAPPGAAIGVLLGAVLGTLSARRGSGGHLALGLAALLPFLLITATAPGGEHVVARVVETLLGAALALLFGVVVPVLLTLLAGRRRVSPR